MTRRTISIPASIDTLIKDRALPGESYSATVARLVEEGARATQERRRLSFEAVFEGPGDLSVNLERYVAEMYAERSADHP